MQNPLHSFFRKIVTYYRHKNYASFLLSRSYNFTCINHFFPNRSNRRARHIGLVTQTDALDSYTLIMQLYKSMNDKVHNGIEIIILL